MQVEIYIQPSEFCRSPAKLLKKINAKVICKSELFVLCEIDEQAYYKLSDKEKNIILINSGEKYTQI